MILVLMLLPVAPAKTSKASAKESGWTIELGATNIVDLSYPIQPNGMSLPPVYPPLIIIEYLANLDKLPEAGALIIAAPINFVDGAQGAARILAVLPIK